MSRSVQNISRIVMIVFFFVTCTLYIDEKSAVSDGEMLPYFGSEEFRPCTFDIANHLR